VSALHVTIPGSCVPSGRPRTGKGRVFKPAKSRAYEAHVRLLALVAARRAKWSPPKGARFSLTLDVYRAIDAGDFDNLAKALTDPLKGIAWPDDRYVTTAVVRLHIDRTHPRAEICVEVAS
jgi:Holliday junction resolvase RusA-like endonuclease